MAVGHHAVSSKIFELLFNNMDRTSFIIHTALKNEKLKNYVTPVSEKHSTFPMFKEAFNHLCVSNSSLVHRKHLLDEEINLNQK